MNKNEITNKPQNSCIGDNQNINYKYYPETDKLEKITLTDDLGFISEEYAEDGVLLKLIETLNDYAVIKFFDEKNKQNFELKVIDGCLVSYKKEKNNEVIVEKQCNNNFIVSSLLAHKKTRV